jgi:hypothetical protein
MLVDLAVAIALGGTAWRTWRWSAPSRSCRHRADGCDLPYIQAHEPEQRLDRNWPLYVKLDLVDAEAVSDQLREELTGHEGEKQVVVRRLTKRPARLDSQRLNLVKMACADAIPLDLLKSEQTASRAMEQVKRELAEVESANGRAYHPAPSADPGHAPQANPQPAGRTKDSEAPHG